MTLEKFNETTFRKGMQILYKGRPYEVAAVDFDRNEIAFINENGNQVWRHCKHIELP